MVFAFCLNMVFNEGTMSKHTKLHPDSKIIDGLGGPTKVAERLGYDKTTGGVQRVQNWRSRGIPAEVKINFPELFMTDLIDRIKSSDDVQSPAGTSGDEKLAKLVM
jgi:hypothetical protein